MKSSTKIISWVLQGLAALILLQTLFFKFTASAESVYIFTTLGIEPVGRIGSGVAELIAGVLLLIPAFCWLGAFIAMGVMSGAILSHLFTNLGIDVLGDGGYLFILAIIVFICSAGIVWIHRKSVPILKNWF